LASSTKSSSPSIEEIVEKLRGIKETSPELYKEAWSKIPHKTQTAILQYEANEKSGHHHQGETHNKPSHESSLTSPSFSHNYPHASKYYEEHQKNTQTRSEARDWEAPTQSHQHQSSTPHHDKGAGHALSSPALAAEEDSAKTDTTKSKTASSSSKAEETEKDLRRSVSAQIPKAHQIMKQAVNERHLPTTLQEVLLATTVYELELIRIGLDKLSKQLEKL
jgi:hypothetical protein